MGMSYEPEEKLLVPTLVPDFSTHKVRHVSCGWMHTLMATGTNYDLFFIYIFHFSFILRGIEVIEEE